MYRIRLAAILLPLLLTAESGHTQEMFVHRADGGTDRYPLSQVDSLVYRSADYNTPRSQTANLNLSLTTDSACYHPGSLVTFSMSNVKPTGAKVRYMHLGRVLRVEDLPGRTWTWQLPPEDYRGYMVEVFVPSSKGETLRGTIAVDVSSDWRRFPRYGFVATFDASKTDAVVADEMDWLSRLHINGVQFQDWHWKHHWPWGGRDGEEMATYTDIANRTIHTASVRRYIDAQHRRGMKSIFYNLCYGVLDDAVDDGVKTAWYLYKDAAHTERDKHTLPSSWKSDIYLVNPASSGWLSYLGERNEAVYSHLDFDGYQVDQLGDRGTLYTNTGAKADLPTAFSTFLRMMKKQRPDKRLVMNAVSSYGSNRIARSGAVDFLYNEVWDSEGAFADLARIVQANAQYGSDTLQTVFAAYMNYGLDGGTFNTGGVLLTDAVMFALGASHLEMGGDHMLCREYFPYASVALSAALKTQLTRYYDFLVAYENLLRDGGRLLTNDAPVPQCLDASRNLTFNAWEPQLGGITTLGRVKDDCTVLHLLNFISANSLSWRDLDGTMPAATSLTNLPLQVAWSQPVSHVYVATPDALGGAMRELDFMLQDGQLCFTLPSLKYWTMLVIK